MKASTACRVGSAAIGLQVEVHRHPLPGARRGVVERKVLEETVVPFTFRLPDPQPESLVILAIPDVAEIDLHLPREEERVRRRKRGDRSARSLRDQQPIVRPDWHTRLVDYPAEPILLRLVAGIAPRHPRQQVAREAAQAPVVFVGDEVLLGLGNRFEPHEVRPTIHRELQAAVEDAHREPGKVDLEAGAIRLHGARRHSEGRVHPANLVWTAREIRISRAPPQSTSCFPDARHQKRRVPEGVPPLTVDHLRRDLDTDLLKILECLDFDPAHAARDLELRGQVLSQGRPLATPTSDRQIVNQRLPTLDTVAGSQLGPTLAPPRHREQVLIHGRREPIAGRVRRQIAVERIGAGRRCRQERHNNRKK